MKNKKNKIIFITSLASAMLVGITAIQGVNARKEVEFSKQESMKFAGCYVPEAFDACLSVDPPLPCALNKTKPKCTEKKRGYKCEQAKKGQVGVTACWYPKGFESTCPSTKKFLRCEGPTHNQRKWVEYIGSVDRPCGDYYIGVQDNGETCIGE